MYQTIKDRIRERWETSQMDPLIALAHCLEGISRLLHKEARRQKAARVPKAEDWKEDPGDLKRVSLRYLTRY